jgi:hypothetical protein
MSTQPKKFNSAEIAKAFGLGDSIDFDAILKFVCNLLDIIGPLVLEKQLSDTCAVRISLEKISVVPGSIRSVIPSTIPAPIKKE